MDITSLKIFMTVARLGSFAAAARKENIDPSSVSRIVAGLENELAVRLFQRTTRNLTLTEAGELYLARIQAIPDELELAREQAIAVHTEPRGPLRITASVAYGQSCLLAQIPAFRSAFPDIELELLLTDEKLNLVDNRIDLAIRLAPEIKTDVICTKLHTTRYHVVASPGYLAKSPPVETPEDIVRQDMILFDLPEYRTEWHFRSADNKTATIPVKGNLVISNALAIRESVLADQGLALLPNWLVDQTIADGHCLDLFPTYRVTATSFDTGAWLLYPSRNFLPLKVRAAVDFLRPRLSRFAPSD
ncbi:LysR family transcriptional regulator [Kiloniella laminariae]|uniref:LysR family transcriptional regulator n=1 Tax=Kiloniella laminariae TaxID=454162 RepID=A0ABT4LHW9_9PROT|nr:LysR family transcriptional regulator [Kiloniella laminariae]MCZ4280686.1 LysR family transcriptional regulator [Kiloniella laminariae]